jgi:hypothetical protein
MLTYLKKFALDILPSVAATIIGAYIVNHYIAAKPDGWAPKAVSSATTKTDTKKAASRTELKADAKTDLTSVPVETATIPEPGVKAKGISERTMIETRAAEKPAEVKPTERPVEAKAVDTKPAETKSAETRPAETGSASAETRRQHAPASPRGANELARAAIERLRGTNESTPHAQEAARASVPDAPRLQEAPRTVFAAPAPPAPVSSAPMVRPLPPPINVSAGPVEGSMPAPGPANPPYTASIDPNRPTPPAEIPPPPPSPPVDLRAEAANAVSHTKTVADDVLSAAKSVFRAVLPGSGQPSGQQFTD